MKLEVLNEIAKKHLGVETLETRNNDEEDFYDISVWDLKSALIEAYNKGAKKDSNKDVSGFIEQTYSAILFYNLLIWERSRIKKSVKLTDFYRSHPKETKIAKYTNIIEKKSAKYENHQNSQT